MNKIFIFGRSTCSRGREIALNTGLKPRLDPALRLVAKGVIGQDQRRHGFPDRRRSNADAGIMPAMGGDFRLVEIAVQRASRNADGGGRFDGETDY
jgi:hypothetical protein